MIALFVSICLAQTTAPTGSRAQSIFMSAPQAGLGLRIAPVELPPSRTRLIFDWAPPSGAGTTSYTPLKAIGERLKLSVGLDAGIRQGAILQLFEDDPGDGGQPAFLGGATIVQVSADEAELVPESQKGLSAKAVALNGSNSTEHLELVWDPAEVRPLTRVVFLKHGNWQVSLSSVAIPFEREPYSNAAWSALTEDGGTYCAHYRVSKADTYPSFCSTTPGWRAVEFKVDRNAVREKVDALIRDFGNEGEVSTPLGSVPRAFGADVADRVAGEALQAVADVAVVRAQQAGLASAKKLIVEKVCGATDPPDAESWAGKLAARLEQQTDIRLRIFPQSCDLLRNANASAFASLGLSIRAALIADATDMLTTFISAQVTNCLGERPHGVCTGLKSHQQFRSIATSIGVVASVVAAAAFDSDATLPRAQAFVTSLARTQPESPELRTAMAVLAYCHKGGSCDSHGLRSLLEHPERVLADGTPIREPVGDYVALVAHGLAVMHPKKGDDAKTHVLNSLRFARGVARVITRSEKCKADPACRETAGQVSEVLDLLFAAAERDPVRLVALAAVAVAKFAGLGASGAGPKILTALATYAETYNQSANLSPEQARQRRAESVAALADIAKERELRVGDPAVAFGTWIGARGGVQDYSRASGDRVGGFFQPSIPVGLLLDIRCTKDHGFWAGVSIVDAGGYAAIATPNTPPAPNPDNRTDDEKRAAAQPPAPSVAAAFQPGIALGWSFWDLALTLDIRLHPWQTGTPRTAFSAGLSLSYVIPFIWLR